MNATSIPILLDYTSLRHFSNWSDAFGNDHSLKVDIGCGKDDSLIERALHEPRVNFIGIEYDRGIAYRLESKVRRSGVTNLRIISFEARFALETFFEGESVQTFFLHFPDPWPKRKHARRRILTHAFVSLLREKLVPGGEFLIATDVLAIAQGGLKVIEGVKGFSNCADEGQFEKQKSIPTRTLYEQKFLRQNLPIYYLRFKKNENPG